MSDDFPVKKRIRGKGRKPRMVHVTLRLLPEVADFYRDNYRKATLAMRNTLTDFVRSVTESRNLVEDEVSIEKYEPETEGKTEDKTETETCEHEYAQETLGRCYNRYTCKKCGYYYEVDSSD